MITLILQCLASRGFSASREYEWNKKSHCVKQGLLRNTCGSYNVVYHPSAGTEISRENKANIMAAGAPLVPYVDMSPAATVLTKFDKQTNPCRPRVTITTAFAYWMQLMYLHAALNK